MSYKSSVGHLAFVSLLSLALSSCYRPPYNNFKPYKRPYVATAQGAAVGTITLAVAGGPILVGTAVGAAVGLGIDTYKSSKRAIIRDLQEHEIQYIEYGDTITLVVPTDRYFMFNSPRFNQLCYPGLANIIRLIQMYPQCPIYIAGFTNDVGSRYHKKTLTQAQAEAMLTLLWANNIHAQRLNAEGYGDKHPVGDNKLIHGSAHNRRLEIQWFRNCSVAQVQPAPFVGYIK